MAMQQDVIEADFIVVGAGSAGCVMAARLSEDPATNVVLLEAGGDDDNRWIHIPLGFGKTFADPSVNWCYETEPDAGAGGRRIFWPRGKVLGGSSRINGMVYIRGQHEDFDLWRQMGCAGWSAHGRVCRTSSAPNTRPAAPTTWHGTGGPLVRVRRAGQASRSARRSSAPATTSASRPTPISTARPRMASAITRPPRATARGAPPRSAICSPATRRSNLRVVTGALAERIVFEGQSRGWRGVPPGRLLRYGPRAARGDPVRRRDQLAAASAAVRRRAAAASDAISAFPVVHHLPGVGQAMQDHYSAPIKLKCRYPITVNDVMLSPAKMLRTGLDYYLRRRGADGGRSRRRWRCSRARGRNWRRRTSRCRSRSSVPTGRRTGCTSSPASP